ncbi:hypothetical protein NDU88_002790 [Pleurodeles waltl]|uniref:Uncharacterized protein n=1 Tax=Pleurodeles waltl TaxID=8319 RepID=A0AAV7LDF5_PLEWA|nr:hypothetical protein NDU88_002790 [Pleurodeles waltl]
MLPCSLLLGFEADSEPEAGNQKCSATVLRRCAALYPPELWCSNGGQESLVAVGSSGEHHPRLRSMTGKSLVADCSSGALHPCTRKSGLRLLSRTPCGNSPPRVLLAGAEGGSSAVTTATTTAWEDHLYPQPPQQPAEVNQPPLSALLPPPLLLGSRRIGAQPVQPAALSTPASIPEPSSLLAHNIAQCKVNQD